MKTFRGREWIRQGNWYSLAGTEIRVYQWNSGSRANFLVTAGFRQSTHIERSFAYGPEARTAAIEYALSLREKYPRKGY